VYLHDNRCHLLPECHLCHMVTLRELKVLKSKICYQDLYMYILLIPNSELFNPDVDVKNRKHNEDFIPELPTVEEAYTA
jgi:hypothetical protein